jgi:hypothetical protein
MADVQPDRRWRLTTGAPKSVSGAPISLIARGRVDERCRQAFLSRNHPNKLPLICMVLQACHPCLAVAPLTWQVVVIREIPANLRAARFNKQRGAWRCCDKLQSSLLCPMPSSSGNRQPGTVARQNNTLLLPPAPGPPCRLHGRSWRCGFIGKLSGGLNKSFSPNMRILGYY